MVIFQCLPKVEKQGYGQQAGNTGPENPEGPVAVKGFLPALSLQSVLCWEYSGLFNEH